MSSKPEKNTSEPYSRKIRREAWNEGYMACLYDAAGVHDRINIEHPTRNPYGRSDDDAPVS